MVLKDGSKPKSVEEHRKLFQKDFVLGGKTKWGTRRRMKKPYKGTGKRPATVYWAHLTEDEWKSLPQHKNWKGFEGKSVKTPEKPDRQNTTFETEKKIKNETDDPLVALVKLLASHHMFIRKNAVDKAEKEFLPSLKKTTFMDMMKLWKGLFYTLWFSDGLVTQNEDSNQLSKLVHQIPTLEAATTFQRAFWKTMERDLQLLDKWRIPKFLLLVRKQFREWMIYLTQRGMGKEEREAYLRTMTAEEGQYHAPLSAAPHTLMSSVRLHLIDIFMEEIKNIPNLRNEDFLFMLRPILLIYIRVDDIRVKEYTENKIITPLLADGIGDFINYVSLSNLFEEIADKCENADTAYELRRCSQLALDKDENHGSDYILQKMENDVMKLEQKQETYESQSFNNNNNNNNLNNNINEIEEDSNESDESNNQKQQQIKQQQQQLEKENKLNEKKEMKMEIDEEIEFDQNSFPIVFSHLQQQQQHEHPEYEQVVSMDVDLPDKMHRMVVQNYRVRHLNRLRRAKRSIMDHLAFQAFQDDDSDDYNDDNESSDDDDDDEEIDYGYEIDPNSDEFKEMEGMIENDENEKDNENRRVKFNLSANKIKVFHKKKTRVRPEPHSPRARPRQSALRK